MDPNDYILLGFVAAVVLCGVVVNWVRRWCFITEYLFFIRYPIMLAAVLVLLPFAAPVLAPESLDNLFVLTPGAVGLVAFLAFFAGWTAVHAGRLIWVSTHSRCELRFWKHRRPKWRVRLRLCRMRSKILAKQPHGTVMTWPWVLVALATTAPIIWKCVSRVSVPERTMDAMVFAAIGLAAGLVLRLLAALVVSWYDDRWEKRQCKGAAAVAPPPVGAPAPAAGNVPANPAPPAPAPPRGPFSVLPRRIRRMHAYAGMYFLITVAVYAVVGLVGRPSIPGEFPVSALAYMLILLMILGWLLPGISFICDRPRVPGVTLAVIVLICMQALAPRSFYFAVQPWTAPAAPLAYEALDARWNSMDGAPMVAVASSGGGITSSLWTALVLEGLQTQIPSFHDRVGLISAVSGGAVATMLYADEFGNGTKPNTQASDFVERASKPSLDALAWGIAYSDVWRLIFGNREWLRDRGWALEQVWDRRFDRPGTKRETPRRLSDWSEGVAKGWRPLHIFNVTLQETGGRLALSPANLLPPPGAAAANGLRMRHDLSSYLANGDMHLATAARLSATFPFVTPQARPIECAEATPSGLHCGDGGYFDNSGVYTALEVLNDYLLAQETPEQRNRLAGRRIALVEIRAANAADAIAGSKPKPRNGGIINNLTGPIEALYNTRVATQIARTAVEYDLHEFKWDEQHGVTVRRFVFHLTGRLPLSWNLSKEDRDRIVAHWPATPVGPLDPVKDAELIAARAYNQKQIDALRAFLAGSGPLAPPALPDPADAPAPAATPPEGQNN